MLSKSMRKLISLIIAVIIGLILLRWLNTQTSQSVELFVPVTVSSSGASSWSDYPGFQDDKAHAAKRNNTKPAPAFCNS